LPEAEDVSASPALVRKVPELPVWMLKHRRDCSCYPCSRPILVSFVIKFFAYQVFGPQRQSSAYAHKNIIFQEK
jgi:hypothetical protein